MCFDIGYSANPDRLLFTESFNIVVFHRLYNRTVCFSMRVSRRLAVKPVRFTMCFDDIENFDIVFALQRTGTLLYCASDIEVFRHIGY
jgi:hypothetical protein